MSNTSETTETNSVQNVESKKIIPTHPDGYADHLSGDWNNVPNWAIARINFLEEVIETREKQRCPLGRNDCPTVPEYSCQIVKHCYPYLCNGACGHNEVWVSEEEKSRLLIRM